VRCRGLVKALHREALRLVIPHYGTLFAPEKEGTNVQGEII